MTLNIIKVLSVRLSGPNAIKVLCVIILALNVVNKLLALNLSDVVPVTVIYNYATV